MKLSDVVDLEAQLASDEGVDEAELRARDRALYLELTPPPSGPEAAVVAWLSLLRARFGAPQLGERVTTARRLVGYGLTLLGLLLGTGTAELLLHFEQGGAPVNVGHYLFVVVFGQLAMLIVLALGFALRRLSPSLPLVGDLGRLLRFVYGRLEQRLARSEASTRERVERERVLYHRVRTRVGLYEGLERYLVLTHTQLFAVAFNVGALATCLRLILLTDIAFGWSTSLASLDANEVERATRALSVPFAWLFPDAQPSHELIARTQYFRLEGRFSGAAAGTRGDPLLAGGWWRFLVACTITYGLLPRVLALAVFRLQFARSERRVPLDTPAVQRLIARLTSPAVSTRAVIPTRAGAEPARPEQSAPPSRADATVLLIYRDVPTDRKVIERALREHLGLAVASAHALGGMHAQREHALHAELRARVDSVTLVAEAWEAPDKSLRVLLAKLREVVGERRTLRVVLVGEARADGFLAPEPGQVRLYRDRLSLLEDAYLSVEALPASAIPEEQNDPSVGGQER